jgi:hypothetical protein
MRKPLSELMKGPIQSPDDRRMGRQIRHQNNRLVRQPAVLLAAAPRVSLLVYCTHNNRTDKLSSLLFPIFVCTLYFMRIMKKIRRGRPPKGSDKIKGIRLDMRLTAAEKEAFRASAELAGLDLSAWVRERLRRAAREELEGAGQPIAFLQNNRGAIDG